MCYRVGKTAVESHFEATLLSIQSGEEVEVYCETHGWGRVGLVCCVECEDEATEAVRKAREVEWEEMFWRDYEEYLQEMRASEDEVRV